MNLANQCVPTHNRVDLWRNLCRSLLYYVVCVGLRYRRKESSRSLSHLLMSFLFFYSACASALLAMQSAVLAREIPSVRLSVTFRYRVRTNEDTIVCFLALVVYRRPSVCLSSVCNVRAPYSGDWNFRQCFYPFGTLAIPDLSVKILRRSSQGNPSVWS